MPILDVQVGLYRVVAFHSGVHIFDELYVAFGKILGVQCLPNQSSRDSVEYLFEVDEYGMKVAISGFVCLHQDPDRMYCIAGRLPEHNQT